MMIAFIIVVLVMLNTAGHLLLKKAALGRGFHSAAMWLGYLLFGSAVVSSFVLLHYIDLKYFIVVMNLNYVAVMLASTVLFRERLDMSKLLATGLVLAGIAIFVGV